MEKEGLVNLLVSDSSTISNTIAMICINRLMDL